MHILELASWGFPIRVKRVRAMAIELLEDKGDTEPLGNHWTDAFLRRHPDIKTKFVTRLDKSRSEAQDLEIFSNWFDLYWTTISKYNIKKRNRYNMDEKGLLPGMIGKVKVMISKYEKKGYMTQPGNREWITLIECISLTRVKLNPFVIFKAKRHQDAWFKALQGVCIGLSHNGWIDNELGLQWLQECFELETRCEEGEYRLLILDGHASHISNKVISFYIASKIILLCLPPHTTHLLQPLDVGVFAPLSEAYRSSVCKKSKYLYTYSVDKVAFLQILGDAREEAITLTNIEKAWAKIGLELFNPKIIME